VKPTASQGGRSHIRRSIPALTLDIYTCGTPRGANQSRANSWQDREVETTSDKPALVYGIVGRVIPERTWATLIMSAPILIRAPSIPWDGEVYLSIDNAQIFATFHGPEFENLGDLRNLAQEFCQSQVDVLGYTWGRSYSVELTSIVTPDHKQVVLTVGYPALDNETSHAARPLGAEVVLNLCLGSPALRNAVSELTRAIRDAADTGFHCQRASESIRGHFQTSNNDATAWRNMQRALRVKAETLKSLKEYGDRQRHGRWNFMPESARTSCLELAWLIVDRFAVLLDRGVDELPESEFPML